MRKAYKVFNKVTASHTSDDTSSLFSEDVSNSNLDESTWHTSDLGQNGSHLATSDCFSLTFAFSSRCCWGSQCNLEVSAFVQVVCLQVASAARSVTVGVCLHSSPLFHSLSPSFGGYVGAFW